MEIILDKSNSISSTNLIIIGSATFFYFVLVDLASIQSKRR